MINSSSSLSIPLSPREIVVREQKRSRWLFIVPIAILLIFGSIAFGFHFLLPSESEISTKETKSQINNAERKIILGKYEICDWVEVKMDNHVPIYVDGVADGFFDSENDILIEGVLCGTNKEVTFAIDGEGLHGSIALQGDQELVISPIDTDFSKISTVNLDVPNYVETEKTKAVERKWMERLKEQMHQRRSMQQLAPGSVDIHLHLDIDYHMVETYGSVFAAARYGVELIAVVNRDAYFDVGFNLKVSSINVRSGSYLSQTANPSAYLDELEKIPRPNNVNLLHSLTTRRLGGGVAYVGGLYSSNSCYGVSGSLSGSFSSWDKIVVAHELGHNFGSPHTHDYSPQIDTCGTNCPASPIGTIMSYCHLCSGGLSNIRFEWADRVRETFLGAYANNRNFLASRAECTSLSTVPDTGVPFYLKGEETCLSIDTSQCPECAVETCSLDSVWQFDGTRIISAADANYCWATDCSTISLQSCDTSVQQQFSFQQGELVSANCGAVKFSGTIAGFNGPTSVNSWCLPDADPNAGPQCDNEVVTLACGQVDTGSTVENCDGEKTFSFTATTSSITVTTCGSSYDTMLSIQTETTRIRSGDDEGNCGRQTILEDVPLTEGEEYFIVLSGYGRATGNYRIEIICPVVGTQSPSFAPTQDPSQTPTSVPSLSPTYQPSQTPTAAPSEVETLVPTVEPSDIETLTPTAEPSDVDTLVPTAEPSDVETFVPTAEPSDVETLVPTSEPSDVETLVPTAEPSDIETLVPTVEPSDVDTLVPTAEPSDVDTLVPTAEPSDVETLVPTAEPSDVETLVPTAEPSDVDTLVPTAEPSDVDTLLPTGEPTIGCDSAPIVIGCGDVLTGTTQNACNGRQTFLFTSDDDSRISVSACGSQFDTTLSILHEEQEIVYNDDSQVCGLGSVLNNVAVASGGEYSIVLGGYSNHRGTYQLELTCGVEPTEAPSCDDEVINIQCGDVLTGSTANACEGQQRFSFTSVSDSVTISSCDSQFDTMLGIQAPSGQLIAFVDDSQACGLHSRIDEVSVTNGLEYVIVLAGYGGVTGEYRLELICPSADPTIDPTVEPTTSSLTSTLEPTLSPTSAPTDPQHSSYGCVFGCGASYSSCGMEFKIARQGQSDLPRCMALCDATPACRFLFLNERRACLLYSDCSTSRTASSPGVNRQRLSNGEQTSSPPISGSDVFEDVFGSSDAPSRTTCHGEGFLSTVCTNARSCSKHQCEDLCAEESECQFFFFNVRGGCMLYRSCDRSRPTSYDGWTRGRVN